MINYLSNKLTVEEDNLDRMKMIICVTLTSTKHLKTL